MKKCFPILLLATLLLAGCDKNINTAIPSSVNSVKDIWALHEEAELLKTDYCLYRVDCACEETTAEFGLYQSVSDREYGLDEATGKTWGYTHKDDYVATTDKFGEGIYKYKWELKEDVEYDNDTTGFYYDFEVPSGEYEIVLGFYDPFSARPVSATVEDELLLDGLKILKYQNNEAIVYQSVTDGELNLKVFNPSRNKDAMKNPILSYICIKAVPRYSRKMLVSYMESVSSETTAIGKYKSEGYSKFLDAYSEAESALISTDADFDNGNQIYRKSYTNLKNAFDELEEIMVYTSFLPGSPWTDTEGNLIQAHGGQVQKLTYKDKETGREVTTWWWVGEDKTNGSHGGICAYSSTDLYNWKYEGIVMRNVQSREALDSDEYFTSLYKGATKEELDNIYRCLSASTAIIERPKLVYNAKTDKYIIWFHADGPTETSSSSYAAASAGVAVADTPYGPFKFIDRYRLNVCPEGQEDFHPESKGMARDMNLFVDDDGSAYIIYSSEENLTLYISKLNDDYTYLATDPQSAVYGEDFVRLFPGAQREAPAVFVHDGKYYLISSGCTGWAPNQARYYMADSILGDWENMGDPCIADSDKTTFNSQSTCVFVTDNGEYVFMADRWNSDDLANSRYIWLPIDFNDDGTIAISYSKEWTLK